MDAFQNQGEREQLQHEIDFKGGQTIVVNNPGLMSTTSLWNHASKQARRFRRFCHRWIFSTKKSISHSCQTNFETLSSWICLLHCGGRVTLFAGGLTQALICKTSKPNCSERLISPMMLNASKYKTSCSHRLLLKSWQNVTQLQIYRTFIFWLRWRPSSNLIVIIFPLLLVNRGSLR